MTHPGTELVREMFAATEAKPILEHRADMEALTTDVPAPPGVEVEAVEVGGRPAERLVPPGGGREGAVLLYLHGGGYCTGDLNSHRDLAGRFALAADVEVVNLHYRRAPEDPFPAAVDDAVAAYRELAASGRRVGLAGDSAGGGLSVAVALVARDAGDPPPAALALLSPWTDLSLSLPAHAERADADPTVTTAGLRQMVEAYLPAHDPTDPLASPVFADLAGLPPMRIDVGEAEILYDDAAVLAQRAEQAGVGVELHVWPELFHVFQAYPGSIVPEAPISTDALARFVAERF